MSNRPNMSGVRGGNHAQAVRLDPNDCNSYHCSNCGSMCFIDAKGLFEIPQLMRAMFGGSDLLETKLYRCLGCGKVCDVAGMQKMTPAERRELEAKAKEAAELAEAGNQPQ